MERTITVVAGEVKRDIYGSWEDCDPGLYVGDTMVESLFDRYRGRRIKVTIELDESSEEEGE